MDLSEEINENINELLNYAEDDIKLCKFDDAIKKYRKALDLLDDNIEEYDISTLIYSSMGDAMYLEGDYNKSINYFYDAMNCPNGIANPYILFRIGQCSFENGDVKKATEYFIRTYMMDGLKLFNISDKKYFSTIREMIDN